MHLITNIKKIVILKYCKDSKTAEIRLTVHELRDLRNLLNYVNHVTHEPLV